jgi:quercetin dioxygenase-like cupin family protein
VTDTVLLPHAGSQVIEHRPAATELFYIAVGLVAVQLGGQVITALPGDLIEARPAARVRLWNPTAEPARVLVLRCGAP